MSLLIFLNHYVLTCFSMIQPDHQWFSINTLHPPSSPLHKALRSFAYHIAANERTFFQRKREAAESHHRSDRSMTLVAAETYLWEIVENKSRRLNPEFLHEIKKSVAEWIFMRPKTNDLANTIRSSSAPSQRTWSWSHCFSIWKVLDSSSRIFCNLTPLRFPQKRPQNERRSSSATAHMKSCAISLPRLPMKWVLKI